MNAATVVVVEDVCLAAVTIALFMTGHSTAGAMSTPTPAVSSPAEPPARMSGLVAGPRVLAGAVLQQVSGLAVEGFAELRQGVGVHPLGNGLAHEVVDGLAREPRLGREGVARHPGLLDPLLELPAYRHGVTVAFPSTLDKRQRSAYVAGVPQQGLGVNTISVKRDFEGRRFHVSARYASEDDGWYVSVSERVDGKSNVFERRGPVSDAWSEIEDMLTLAMQGSYDPPPKMYGVRP